MMWGRARTCWGRADRKQAVEGSPDTVSTDELTRLGGRDEPEIDSVHSHSACCYWGVASPPDSSWERRYDIDCLFFDGGSRRPEIHAF